MRDRGILETFYSTAIRAAELTESQAGAVGTLAAQADHDDVVDVLVVEGALRRNHAVVTSNASHIRKVATAAGADITIQSV